VDGTILVQEVIDLAFTFVGNSIFWNAKKLLKQLRTFKCQVRKRYNQDRVSTVITLCSHVGPAIGMRKTYMTVY